MSTTLTWRGKSDEEYEITVRDLQEKNSDLAKDYSDLANHNADLLKKNRDLRGDNESLQQNNAALAKTNTNLRIDNRDLRINCVPPPEIADPKRLKEKLRQNIKSLRDEKYHDGRTIFKRNKELKWLNEEFDWQTRKIALLENDKNDLKQEISDLKANIPVIPIIADKQILQQENINLIMKNSELDERCADLDESSALLADEVTQLKDTQKQLFDNLRQLDSANENLKAQVADVQAAQHDVLIGRCSNLYKNIKLATQVTQANDVESKLRQEISQLEKANNDFFSKIRSLEVSQNDVARQNSNLKVQVVHLQGAQTKLVRENGNLELQVTHAHEAQRHTEAQKADVERRFKELEEYTDKVEDQVEYLNRKLRKAEEVYCEERYLVEKELKKAEKENENYKLWFGVNSPTVITPITPSKYKQPKSIAVPRTPYKNTHLQIFIGAGKVRSVNAHIQKELNRWDAVNPGTFLEDTPPYHLERRAMINPDEFQYYQDAISANNSPLDENDDSGIFAGTPTKQKRRGPKTSRPRKMVPKSHVGRKATANKAAAKPTEEMFIEINSNGEESLVMYSNPRGRRVGASAQADDENAQSYGIQEDGVQKEEWSVNCICGSSHDTPDWVACTQCEAWSHTECYGYDVQAVSADEFVHLCPACAQKVEEDHEKTTSGKKRKRSSDDDNEDEDHSGGKGKQPRHKSWTDNEKNMLAQAMEKHLNLVASGRRDAIYDAKLFALLSQDIAKLGVERGGNACKNMWNRELREATCLDERREKNPSKLATSIQ